MDEQGLAPNWRFCDTLMSYLITSKAHDVGDKAEELLARMEVRKALQQDKEFDDVNHQTYMFVLHCWKQSAKFRYPGAADRAYRLLRSMEIQSGLDSVSVEEFERLSDEEKTIVDAVYDRDLAPQCAAYNEVLLACGHVSLKDEQRHAMGIADEVYSNMLKRGVVPDSATYNYLLNCCHFLLPPQDKKRRRQLAMKYFDDALERQMDNDLVWKALGMMDSKLHHFYSTNRPSSSSSPTAATEEEEEGGESTALS
uniref:Uncharacterized protein n=1 Tax=Cyclophora tenuis TaxID=216820 RepID=A0A7S1CXM8_CYCTE